MNEEPEVLDAKEILRGLIKMQHTLPTMTPMTNALAYCVIAIEHLLQHAHDEETIEH